MVAGLIPALLSSLIIDMAHRVVVEGLQIQKFMDNLVKSAPIIGRHTSIVHISDSDKGKVGVCYVWAPRALQPWGNPLPPQCPVCLCFRSWGKYTVGTNNCLSFACGGVNGNEFICRHTITFQKPDNVISVGLHRSDWMKLSWP